MKQLFIIMIFMLISLSFIMEPSSANSTVHLLAKLPNCYADKGTTAHQLCDNSTITADFSNAGGGFPTNAWINLTDYFILNYIIINWSSASGGTDAAGIGQVLYLNGPWILTGLWSFTTPTLHTTILLGNVTAKRIQISFLTKLQVTNWVVASEVWIYGTDIPAVASLGDMTDISIFTSAIFIFAFALTFALGERKHPLFFAFSGVIGLSFAYTLYTLITSLIISGIIAGVSVIIITYSFFQKIKRDE